MTPDERRILASILLESTRQLLDIDSAQWRVLGETIQVADRPEAWASTMGLTGDLLKGALVMIARPELFRRAYPAELHPELISTDALADWAGEVGNQLLGRIKNRVHPYGLDFRMSTPTVLSGERLSLLRIDCRATCIQRAVDAAGERLDLMLEVVRGDGGRVLSTLEPNGSQPTNEGDILLFRSTGSIPGPG